MIFPCFIEFIVVFVFFVTIVMIFKGMLIFSFWEVFRQIKRLIFCSQFIIILTLNSRFLHTIRLIIIFLLGKFTPFVKFPPFKRIIWMKSLKRTMGKFVRMFFMLLFTFLLILFYQIIQTHIEFLSFLNHLKLLSFFQNRKTAVFILFLCQLFL